MTPVVLLYHQVLERPRPEHHFMQFALTVDQFRDAMAQVKRDWRVLDVGEFASIAAARGRWPKKSVLITFDDGFRNNLLAAQALRDLGLGAIFFVTSGAVGTRFKPWFVTYGDILTRRTRDQFACSWGSVDFQNRLQRRQWIKRTRDHLLGLRPAARASALAELGEASGWQPSDAVDPELEFFQPQDLAEMRRLGMTIGGHSRTHDNLADCTPDELKQEVLESSDQLEAWSGAPVRYFAYPDGRYNAQTLEMVRNRFDGAFTLENRYSVPDAWRYPRRAADGYTDVSEVLSPLFPAKRRMIGSVKSLLRC